MHPERFRKPVHARLDSYVMLAIDVNSWHNVIPDAEPEPNIQ